MAARREIPLRRNCGAMSVHMMLLERFAPFRARQFRLEQETARLCASTFRARAYRVVHVRTVVHVVHHSAVQDISRAQIRSQVVALNRDFGATNPDRAKVPDPWRGLVTDSKIRFRLVKVTRTRTSRPTFSYDDSVKRAASGGIPPYRPASHLNIWVCALAGGLLGYAQFPGGPRQTDGVVIHYRAFGTMGTAQAPFDHGRTATHEIGHYFNLRHIWGDTEDCRGGDSVADTPNCAGPNTGRPAFPKISCNNGPNGDMFMNFMDYTDDAAMQMFTTQQVARMRAALSGPRSGL